MKRSPIKAHNRWPPPAVHWDYKTRNVLMDKSQSASHGGEDKETSGSHKVPYPIIIVGSMPPCSTYCPEAS
ncbi:hypothetical protein PanWU01x14_016660 [Parasponia andersonii]|uniref:Uncharacterized protein n=1 Tax=Parasponia andersonii TaxID=3476 RepID=A0A2P5DZQ6_PARAD|nr:hypothetical protein PanWU01x14_016660 [Parasponia andersonii]